jgi:hypothetical protein
MGPVGRRYCSSRRPGRPACEFQARRRASQPAGPSPDFPVRGGPTGGRRTECAGTRRAGVTGHHHVWPPAHDLAHDPGETQPTALRVEQPDLMTGVDQGSADHQQAKRHLVPHAEVRGDRPIGRVDQENLHASLRIPRREWPMAQRERHTRGARTHRVMRSSPALNRTRRRALTAESGDRRCSRGGMPHGREPMAPQRATAGSMSSIRGGPASRSRASASRCSTNFSTLAS